MTGVPAFLPRAPQFSSVVNVTFPTYYRRFLSWVEVFEFDLAWVATLGCHFDIDFYDRLLAITIAPLIVLAFLGLTFCISRARCAGDEGGMARARKKHLAALILVTFLVYSTASSTIFQTFACDACDDGLYYLRADYSLVCHMGGVTNERHLGYMVYAGCMVLVYPVGIPALYGFLLYLRWRWRAKVGGREAWGIETFHEDAPGSRNPGGQREASARSYDAMVVDLWKPYKRERSYYEVVECARRVMLTGVVVFVFPDSAAQVSTTFLIALFFFVISEAQSPYATEYDCWMSRFGHVVVLLSMFVALMVKVDVDDESETGLQVYSVVLVVANVFMALAIVVESAMAAYLDVSELTCEED